jgi:Holliday junction DNA helicase RuvB
MNNSLTNPSPHQGDGVLDNRLRPQLIADFIGQRKMLGQLTVAIGAAQSRKEAVPHLLFHGPPGTGKTSIAGLIARSMGSQLHCTTGPALERTADVLGLLVSLNTNDVLFIDEIHALTQTMEEFVYGAMEDRSLGVIVDKGISSHVVKIPLQEFTLVGATTMAGKLSTPLRDRFGLVLRLEYYTVDELAQIVKRSAAILNMQIDDESAIEIAKRSRGTPRIANRLLARVRDFKAVEQRPLNREMLQEAFDLAGVDADGLDTEDKRYLECLQNTYRGGPVGIAALSATLCENRDTLESMIEPWLLFKRKIARTSRGRMLL